MGDNWIKGVTLAHLQHYVESIGFVHEDEEKDCDWIQTWWVKNSWFLYWSKSIHDEIKCHVILLCKSMNDCYLWL